MQSRERASEADDDRPPSMAAATARTTQPQTGSPPLGTSARSVDLQLQAAAEFSFSRFVGRSTGSGFGALSQRGMSAAAASQEKERRPGVEAQSSAWAAKADSRPRAAPMPSAPGSTSGEEGVPHPLPVNTGIRPAPVRPPPSKGRVNILAGAGPPPRVVSPDFFAAAGPSSSYGRAYTPPNLHPVAPATAPRSKSTHRKAATEGEQSLSSAVAGQSLDGEGGEGVDAVHRLEAPLVDLRPQNASSRLSSSTIVLDLDEDFQAARDLVNKVSPIGWARGDGGRMSPVAEEDEEEASQGQPVDGTGMLVETALDEPLPDVPPDPFDSGRQISPGPPSTDDPLASTSHDARPRKNKPTKSASRTGSGGSNASARTESAVGDGEILEAAEGSAVRVLSRGSSGTGPGQSAASLTPAVAGLVLRSASGGVKRRRSRSDAERLDSSGAPADDLQGLIQAALRQADQKAEVIKTLTAENSTLKHSLKTMKAAVKETASKAKSVECLLETVQREARAAREHFNKSHNLLLDEVLELKSDVGGHRSRLDDYFSPTDNWFDAMRDKLQDAVGPLHESLESAKERAQSSAETVELLKRELGVKVGDLAERTARVQELEGRDASKDAIIKAKDEKLAELSSEAQSTRLQAVVLESQIGQLKEAVAAAQADAARKDGDLALDRQALMQAKDEADGLRHRLEVAELDGARAARNAEDACQQLAVIESRLVATQVALGEEKGGRLALAEQLKDARLEAQQATTAAGLAEQAKQLADAAVKQSGATLEVERKKMSELRVALTEARSRIDTLQMQVTRSDDLLKQSAEQASGDKQAEIAILTARIETIEGELIATRANVEEREAQVSELERQIAGDRVGREEAVARLQAQLSEQEAAVREERHLSTMELAELREKAKKIAAANEEASQLRTKLKATQEALDKITPEVVELRVKHASLSCSTQRLDSQRKTIAERYRSNELDPDEQGFIKNLTKTIEDVNIKQQVDLENKLRRAERTIGGMREEKALLEKQWTKQLARSGSGKTRDLIEDNALDQSSTPSSVPDQRRIVAEGSVNVAIVESRTNSASTEANGPNLGRATSAGRLTALDDDDDDDDGQEVAVESLVPKSSDTIPVESSSLGKAAVSTGKRPASPAASAPATTRSGDDKPPLAKKLRSSAQSDVGTSSLGRASLGTGKTYKKAGGASSRRLK